ncbi:MAG: hypothetical protein H6Q25_869 [Bacteroidetes bacterium]|nr:hypothetical protein [Bacteroidota bacterium]
MSMKKLLSLLFLLFFLQLGYSTNPFSLTPLRPNNAIHFDDTIKLLPDHYLFTQKIFWGEKGLMRNFDMFKLSSTSRDIEMNIRSVMITTHQYLAFASLVGMLGTGITGQYLYNGSRIKDIHEGFATFTNITYFTSLGTILFTPPPMKDRAKGFTKFRIHRAMSIVHVSSMLAVNILSSLVEDYPVLRPYHRAAGILAFSSLFVATVTIKL